MTSLAHDRLLEQGSAPKNGARTAPATARTTTARRRAGAREEQAAEPRPRTAQRSTPTRTTGDARPSTTTAAKKTAPARATAKPTAAKAAPAKAAPAKAAPAKAAPAKAAPAKAAPAKAAPATTAKAASAKAASAKAAPATTAKAAPAKAVSAKAVSAKAAPAKAVKAKPTPAKTTAGKTTPAKTTTAKRPAAKRAAAPAGRRPIPRPRPTPEALDSLETPVVEATVVAEPLEPTALREKADQRRWFRRLPGPRRRPPLSLAAALIGAIAVSTAVVSTEAQAETTTHVSESVSVAKQLGISSSEARLSPAAAGAELRDMVVSRNERTSEQAHAALVQSRAERVVQHRRAVAAAEAARPQAVLPVKGARYTSCFCSRWGTFHYGIDLAAPIGTPEYAAMDGVVLEAGPASGFGLAVYIQHANGDVTVYGHMEQILVKAGQVVRAGDTIALLGNRGQSTGPHLHFEVHVGGINGQKVDPIPWLAARGVHV